MDKLLFLSAHLPAADAKEAGQKTAFRNLELLAQKYEIYLTAFRNENETECDITELQQLCSSIRIFDVSTSMRLGAVCKNPSLPLLVSVRYFREAEDHLKSLIQEYKFDRLHCEYGQMACYAPVLSGIPVKTIYLHDVLTQWASRRCMSSKNPANKMIFYHDYRKSAAWEKYYYIRYFDRVYVPSEKDKKELLAINQDLEPRLNVLPLYFQTFTHSERKPEEGAIMFWGAMNRVENEQAAVWFVKNVWPKIKQRVSNAKLYMVGNAPTNNVKKLAGQDIIITGFVEDPGPYFSRAQLAVVPLLTGAGVKAKTIESLAAGLPVIASDIGAEGIDASKDEGLIVVPDGNTSSFANEVCSLLIDPKRCFELGQIGARWVRSHYNPDLQCLLEV